MRIGNNPHKKNSLHESNYTHQVIIPVFIPHHEDYFKDSFKIFQLCLNSLFITKHNETFITIVNNGSCDDVKEYLNDLFTNNLIHEVIHTDNVGKFNAVLKGIVGNHFPLVTISDSDVLFLDNWQNATVEVFNIFSKAGVVGLVPQFRSFGENSTNLIFETLFSKKVTFTSLEDINGIKKFYESLGWDTNYNQDYLKYILTIEEQNYKAIVGSGHFIATYRRELFDEIKTYSNLKMGPKALKYIDLLPLKFNLWRLTTNKNYAYHLGNTYENWMNYSIDSLAKNSQHRLEFISNSNQITKENRLLYFIKNKFFKKIFNKRKIRKIYYKYKGLSKYVASKY